MSQSATFITALFGAPKGTDPSHICTRLIPGLQTALPEFCSRTPTDIEMMATISISPGSPELMLAIVAWDKAGQPIPEAAADTFITEAKHFLSCWDIDGEIVHQTVSKAAMVHKWHETACRHHMAAGTCPEILSPRVADTILSSESNMAHAAVLNIDTILGISRMDFGDGSLIAVAATAYPSFVLHTLLQSPLTEVMVALADEMQDANRTVQGLRADGTLEDLTDQELF